MSALKISGIVLIAAGSLGLAYGGFGYTKETRRETGARLARRALLVLGEHAME